MIHERIMGQGSFDIPLKNTTPWTIWENSDTLGHVVILPQWVDLAHYNDAALLSLARYSGVLLDKRVNDDRMWFSGAGMVWWLGDEDGKGELYESTVSLSASTLSNTLDNLLPDAITKGTVTEPANAYNGEHAFETPLEAIRTVCAATSAEFRVNPDGTLDAGSNYDLYSSIDDPTIVVVRQGFGGGTDPSYTGVPNNFIEGRYSSRRFSTRSILVETDINGAQSLAANSNRTHSWKDIHGNAVIRTVQQPVQSNELTTYGYYTQTNLEDHDHIDEERLRTDYYEVANKGDWQVGEAYYVYDPPMFRDVTNKIWFRGDHIYPKLLRLIQADWTIRERMGVYYRPPETSPTWTDLTPYVDEELSDSIAVLRSVERNVAGGV